VADAHDLEAAVLVADAVGLTEGDVVPGHVGSLVLDRCRGRQVLLVGDDVGLVGGPILAVRPSPRAATSRNAGARSSRGSAGRTGRAPTAGRVRSGGRFTVLDGDVWNTTASDCLVFGLRVVRTTVTVWKPSGSSLASPGGGQREDPLGDPGAEAVDAAPAVQLEVELALEGVIDRLDQLPDRFEQVFAGARGAVAIGRAQQANPSLGEEAVQLADA
jgi:hypothetical protein